MAPSDADRLLSQYLGDNLQTATVRLIGGAVAIAAIVALIVKIIG